jgi:hypothetical protein
MSNRKSRRNNWLVSQQPNQSNTATSAADNKQNSASRPNSASASPGEKELYPKSNNSAMNTKNDKKHWLEYATGFFAFIAAGGAIFAASFSGWQASVASDTEKRQLRAYVGIIAGDVENFDVSGRPTVRLTRKNYGLTPAYDVGFSTIYARIGKDGTIFQQSGGGCTQPNYSNLSTMFPSAQLPFSIIIKDTYLQQQVDEVKAGSSIFYVYGDVCYKDIFGNPHYTNYCWMYKGDMSGKEADACLQHNDSN